MVNMWIERSASNVGQSQAKAKPKRSQEKCDYK